MEYRYPLYLPNVTKTFTEFEAALKNENERLEQTRKALNLIIEKGYFNKIVLIDGSNFSVLTQEEIETIYKKYGIEIEQLIFQQDIVLVEKFGKGHGEMQITNYLVDNSRLVKEAGGFVKLTPRYIFDNIDSILSVVKENKNVFFFYYPPLLRRIKPFVMTIFYKTSIEFYKANIEQSLNEHDKNIKGYAESIFYRHIITLKKHGIKCPYPYFSGISGTTGKRIKNQYVVFRNFCSRIGILGYSFE